MNAIPHDAKLDDPRWEKEFLELAHGLVLAGAKTKLIARFTGLSIRKIRGLYMILRGFPAQSGPLVQGKADFFATRNPRTSAAWRIQCAVFLACYERIGTITEQELNRGWQLLAAYNAYMKLTETLKKTTAVKRLDINQAYALLTHCGFFAEPNAELQLRECPACLIRYPLIACLSIRAQPCPICAMDANGRRLGEQAVPASRKRAALRR